MRKYSKNKQKLVSKPIRTADFWRLFKSPAQESAPGNGGGVPAESNRARISLILHPLYGFSNRSSFEHRGIIITNICYLHSGLSQWLQQPFVLEVTIVTVRQTAPSPPMVWFQSANFFWHLVLKSFIDSSLGVSNLDVGILRLDYGGLGLVWPNCNISVIYHWI